MDMEEKISFLKKELTREKKNMDWNIDRTWYICLDGLSLDSEKMVRSLSKSVCLLVIFSWTLWIHPCSFLDSSKLLADLVWVQKLKDLLEESSWRTTSLLLTKSYISQMTRNILPGRNCGWIICYSSNRPLPLNWSMTGQHFKQRFFIKYSEV